jgi:uncharacterized membrane protein
MKRRMMIAAVFVTVFIVVMLTGCTYTHPSKATPDLVERITNGHIICYYRNGLDRGYAKCCPECPMHTADSNAITGVK